MEPPTPVVRSGSIADQVYGLLRRDIASGVFRPGDRILEKMLSQRWGISRTPIREALLRLETEGVVVCNSRRSYNVRILTVDDVREIYETLGILEGAVAGAVASSLTREDLNELEHFNRMMETAAAEANLQAFGEWNRKFHDVFILKQSNRTLHETCNLVRGLLYTFPVQRDSLADWLRKSVMEHRTIIELIADGNAQAVADYFRDVHWGYEHNRRFITDAFDRQGEAAVHF